MIGFALTLRFAQTIGVLLDGAQVDGAHHLRWVLDQALQAAAGTPEAYQRLVTTWEQEHPGCTWDRGIAP